MAWALAVASLTTWGEVWRSRRQRGRCPACTWGGV